MPELPEVETVCRGLARHLPDMRVESVIVRRRDLRIPLPLHLEQSLQGRAVQKIERRAKYVLIHLDNHEVLIVHLGMSGSMVLKEKPTTSYRTHDHVIINWVKGKQKLQLLFHDPRRFGLMALAPASELATHKLFAGLGPEPLGAALSGAYLYGLFASSKAPVKSVIMDQRKLVGVGNIYACEALFLSAIHPARIASKVTKKEAELLAASIKKVLKAAIASGGSTLRDYVRSSGDTGYFQHHFNVYGRQKLPCPVCGKTIHVIRQSGRSSFFCPGCQK